MTEPLFPARIIAIVFEAEDILSFILQPQDAALPALIEAGSHVDVRLPNGMMRSYSLSNGPSERRGYRLTVARDANSRGGSAFMHDHLRVGETLEISRPRNNFELAENAPLSVFFAGGIGVTPFIPMAARLNETGKRWRLYHCSRSRDRAAFSEEIAQLAAEGAGEYIAHHDDIDGLFDLIARLRSLPTECHVYCCGPAGMLDAFRAGAEQAGFPSNHVHFEYFSAEIESATEGGFVVVLNQSGRDCTVQPGQTILQALLALGIDLPYSCEEGVCGACETWVIEGIPDHRDMVLTDDEKRANRTMMVCCSGSKSSRLVLDL